MPPPRWFPFLVVVAGLSLCPAWAAPTPDVRIEPHGDGFAVSARLSVEVTRATAWGVITDYDRVRDFVPDVDESRVVSRAGEPTLVRQAGAWSLLGFRVPVRILAQVEETPMHSVRFHSISGNVRVENGEWRIAEERGGVAISYQLVCTPDFWVPPVLGALLIRRDVRAKLEQVAREMLRRDAAQRRLPSLSVPEPAT
jgi:hypothetical protein